MTSKIMLTSCLVSNVNMHSKFHPLLVIIVSSLVTLITLFFLFKVVDYYDVKDNANKFALFTL